MCKFFSSIFIVFACFGFAADSRAQGLDPTKPLSGDKMAARGPLNRNLVLESIFHGSDGGKTHTVIINGQALKVNDFIGEYRLVAVNDDSVVLRSSEKRLKLTIFTSIITK